jgi:hypothetical protein
MQVAMVVRWKHPYVGREKQALEYGVEVQEFWRQHAQAGRTGEPEMFFCSSGTGMWMVRGDRSTLDEVWNSDASQRLLAKGTLLLEDFGWEVAIAGPSAEEYMGRYAAVGGELGLL